MHDFIAHNDLSPRERLRRIIEAISQNQMDAATTLATSSGVLGTVIDPPFARYLQNAQWVVQLVGTQLEGLLHTWRLVTTFHDALADYQDKIIRQLAEGQVSPDHLIAWVQEVVTPMGTDQNIFATQTALMMQGIADFWAAWGRFTQNAWGVSAETPFQAWRKTDAPLIADIPAVVSEPDQRRAQEIYEELTQTWNSLVQEGVA